MRNTKKLALSALLVAMGASFMVLGAVVEVLDLAVCALASLLVAFVYIEIGSPYTWLVWLCTSIVVALIFPGSLVWLEYFAIFGIWPILKAYVERLPKWSWLIIKLAFINAIIWLMIFFAEKILGVPFFEDSAFILKAATYALINVAFIVYDMFITVMVRFYMAKLRQRFRRLLK